MLSCCAMCWPVPRVTLPVQLLLPCLPYLPCPTVQFLQKICKNVRDNPSEDKYRKAGADAYPVLSLTLLMCRAWGVRIESGCLACFSLPSADPLSKSMHAMCCTKLHEPSSRSAATLAADSHHQCNLWAACARCARRRGVYARGGLARQGKRAECAWPLGVLGVETCGLGCGAAGEHGSACSGCLSSCAGRRACLSSACLPACPPGQSCHHTATISGG